MARPPRILLFDGYVDEPANFGVPPYMSPHARYLAGAARAAHPEAEVSYLTVDEWRRGSWKAEKLESADWVVFICGALVPGKYLRGTPLSWNEARRIASRVEGRTLLVGSSALYGFGRGGGLPPAGRGELDSVFDYRSTLHGDALLYDLLQGHVESRRAGMGRKRTMEEWRRWAIEGAFIIREHPDWPLPLTLEIDTYHGCVRYINGGCSFCMEPKEGKPLFRPVEDVVEEVRALARQGARSFRLGGQACFFSFHARGVGETPTPEPNPSAIERLLVGIRSVVPDLHTLHLDNVDPAVVAAHPGPSLEITKLVVEHMTDGNVAAFGLESADPRVKERNNLNADPQTVFRAAEILHRYGRRRGPHGFPSFLPGINFLAGLAGETEETYRLNLEFLREYRALGFWCRRVNIRKVVVGGVEVHVDPGLFHRFKEEVRRTFDRPLLEEMFPSGTVLRRIFVETHEGGNSFGRPLGTYALLVGIPYDVPVGTWVDVSVTDHGFRSVTGIEHPFPINQASLRALSSLPGVGKKRAARLALRRPFRNPSDLERALDDPELVRSLLPLVGLS